MKYFRYGFLLLMFILQSCSTSAVATPTLEQPSTIPPTQTAEIVELTPTPTIGPPAGFKQYQDTVVGVSIFFPESWLVTAVISGDYTMIQSYPEDKYIGGEPFQPGDTKCTLRILPPDTDMAGYIEEVKSSVNVSNISEQDIVLNSGMPGKRLEIDDMGLSNSLLTEVNERLVELTCIGELTPFDEIAVTIGEVPITATLPTIEPPVGFKQYQDSVVGASIFLPESWVVTMVDPGESAILQSYPEDKYVGGEAFQTGDTKCDLTIRPADIDMANYHNQLKSDPTITIVSEEVVTLQSGKLGIRLEIESLGRSNSLITEINSRVIVLSCFGELAPFDEIAITLRASE